MVSPAWPTGLCVFLEEMVVTGLVFMVPGNPGRLALCLESSQPGVSRGAGCQGALAGPTICVVGRTAVVATPCCVVSSGLYWTMSSQCCRCS